MCSTAAIYGNARKFKKRLESDVISEEINGITVELGETMHSNEVTGENGIEVPVL